MKYLHEVSSDRVSGFTRNGRHIVLAIYKWRYSPNNMEAYTKRVRGYNENMKNLISLNTPEGKIIAHLYSNI